MMDAIIRMDADVYSIEASKSHMNLLEIFAKNNFPNMVGPGLFDVHSDRIPTKDEMLGYLKKACTFVKPELLWTMPDCGLKTRTWDECQKKLSNLQEAAFAIRKEVSL